MLATLKNIFDTMQIEAPDSSFIKLHSHTSKEQGLFLQKIFDMVKPKKSIEVGLAYGISTLFILEKHKEMGHTAVSHIAIEPFSWGGVPEHNIKKEGLENLIEIRYKKSDEVLPKLFYENHHVQFAYIDTTKLFDTVLQDFYFIDKILDVNGIVILDDCGGAWPGVQRVARFINTLPHYKLVEGHNKSQVTLKRNVAGKVTSWLIKKIPFKNKFYNSTDFRTDSELGLDYSCLAFKKIAPDQRDWRWDKPI